MQTITIDILNEKVIKLLQDLEGLMLIRLRKEKEQASHSVNWLSKYKGAMTKQPLDEIAKQLNDLRSSWE
jgi:hypothetical protein